MTVDWTVTCFSKIMVLHLFVKKTGKTPARELATARRRMGMCAGAFLFD
jgi:phage-related protein